MNLGAIKKLKPNVTFQVPNKLFDYVNNLNPVQVFKGKLPVPPDEGGLSE